MRNKELSDVLLGFVDDYKDHLETDKPHFSTYMVKGDLHILLTQWDAETQQSGRGVGGTYLFKEFGYKSVKKFKNDVIDILEENGLKYLGHFEK